MGYLTFIFISAGLIVIPGPNVLVIVSTSIAHGRKRGLQTVAGTSCAMAVQLLIAALGTGYLVTLLSSGFIWLKWLGVTYLVYLGCKHWLAIGGTKPRDISATGSFQRGFWVSLTNPKTILFFSAFLPQFASPATAFMPQIILLSITFWLLAILFDSAYACLSHTAAALLKMDRLEVYQNGVVGALYMGAGTALALTNKS